jgi:cytochrome c553
VILGARIAALAQTPPPPVKDAPKSYTPGLEVFMNLIQTEHAKLWYAGSAGNWELAAYQLGEIKEIVSDVQHLVPTFRKLPLDKMMDAVITKEIADLEKALDEKSAGKFAASFTALTEACNACHQATGNGFIVIQRPTGQAFPNQDFRPHK